MMEQRGAAPGGREAGGGHASGPRHEGPARRSRPLEWGQEQARCEQGSCRRALSSPVPLLAGPWFLTLRVLQLGSAPRDLPLPGRNPEGQVTGGWPSWDRQCFSLPSKIAPPGRAERQAAGVASRRLEATPLPSSTPRSISEAWRQTGVCGGESERERRKATQATALIRRPDKSHVLANGGSWVRRKGVGEPCLRGSLGGAMKHGEGSSTGMACCLLTTDLPGGPGEGLDSQG